MLVCEGGKLGEPDEKPSGERAKTLPTHDKPNGIDTQDSAAEQASAHPTTQSLLLISVAALLKHC